jgi:hypothetical protein
MKVVKHLACVWHWCGIRFNWVGILNHCSSPSFVARKLPRFLGDLFPKLCQQGLLECCMNPYAHPLHMKVVKHLACVWHWCGINLDWVYSLNHCTSPSFVAQELPRFLGDLQSLVNESGRNVVRTHPYSHPLHMKVVKYLFMWLTLMWDQSWLGLQPQSLHFTIICCPRVTQISRWLPKAWSMRAAVML